MHTVCFNNVTGINGILYCDDGEACCGVANDQWCCQGHDHGNNTWYIAILIAVSTLVSLVLLIVSVFILKYLKTRDIHRTQRIIGNVLCSFLIVNIFNLLKILYDLKWNPVEFIKLKQTYGESDTFLH